MIINLLMTLKIDSNKVESLIKEINTNDLAFSEFYKITRVQLYGYILSIVKNIPDAQDILQSTYIKIYDNIDKYTSKNKPMAWIFTIARNLAYETIRKSKRTVHSFDDWEKYLVDYQDINIEDRLLVSSCLAKLKDKEKQIIILHAVSGFKHKEIAELLDINLSTALSKYNRALKKLKKIMEEYYNGKRN